MPSDGHDTAGTLTETVVRWDKYTTFGRKVLKLCFELKRRMVRRKNMISIVVLWKSCYAMGLFFLQIPWEPWRTRRFSMKYQQIFNENLARACNCAWIIQQATDPKHASKTHTKIKRLMLSSQSPKHKKKRKKRVHNRWPRTLEDLERFCIEELPQILQTLQALQEKISVLLHWQMDVQWSTKCSASNCDVRVFFPLKINVFCKYYKCANNSRSDCKHKANRLTLVKLCLHEDIPAWPANWIQGYFFLKDIKKGDHCTMFLIFFHDLCCSMTKWQI